VAKFINQLPTAVISLSEQIENATGVNILSHLQRQEIAPKVKTNSTNDKKEEEPQEN
jgi:hypothetical protein